MTEKIKLNTQYSGTVLEDFVLKYWADFIEIDIKNIASPGLTVLPRENFRDRGIIFHYKLKQHHILRVDPTLLESLTVLNGKSDFVFDDVNKLFPDKTVELEGPYPNLYLEPSDFTPYEVNDDVQIKLLPKSDYKVLNEFYDQCSEQDLDDAEILLDEPDPIIFLAWKQDKIVAYASHRYWADVIADIGVLTHPDHRGIGLGKRVVSADTKWCLENNIIPQYRTSLDNPASHSIAKALSFTHYFDIHCLELKAK